MFQNVQLEGIVLSPIRVRRQNLQRNMLFCPGLSDRSGRGKKGRGRYLLEIAGKPDG